MKNIEFLVAAYSFIWVLLAYFFFISGKKVNALEVKLRAIEEEKGIKED